MLARSWTRRRAGLAAAVIVAVAAIGVPTSNAQDGNGDPAHVAAVADCTATTLENSTAPDFMAALPNGGFVTAGPNGVHVFDSTHGWQRSVLTESLLGTVDVGPDGRVVTTSSGPLWTIDPATGDTQRFDIPSPFRPIQARWADATSVYAFNYATGVSRFSLPDLERTAFIAPTGDFIDLIGVDTLGRLYTRVSDATTFALSIRRYLPDGTLDIEYPSLGPVTAGYVFDTADRLVEIAETSVVYADDGTVADSFPTGIPGGATPMGAALLADGSLLVSANEIVYRAPSLSTVAVPISLTRPAVAVDTAGHALAHGGAAVASRIDDASGRILDLDGDPALLVNADPPVTRIRGVGSTDGFVAWLVDTADGRHFVRGDQYGLPEPISADAVLAVDSGSERPDLWAADLAGNLLSTEGASLRGSGSPIVAAFVDGTPGWAYRVYPDGRVTVQSMGGGSETVLVAASVSPVAPTPHDLTVIDGRVWVADSAAAVVHAFAATDGAPLGSISSVEGLGGGALVEPVAIMSGPPLVLIDQGTLITSTVICTSALPDRPGGQVPIRPEFTG